MLKNGLLLASCSRLMSQHQRNLYRQWLLDSTGPRNNQNSGRGGTDLTSVCLCVCLFLYGISKTDSVRITKLAWCRK